MRISDWSSDVCSSDLRDLPAAPPGPFPPAVAFRCHAADAAPAAAPPERRLVGRHQVALERPLFACHLAARTVVPAAEDRSFMTCRLALLDRKSTRLNSSH